MKRVIIIVFFLLSACAGRRVTSLSEIELLLSSTISFPDNIICVQRGEISHLPDSVRFSPKLLFFADSTDCTECLITKLPLFEKMFTMAKESGRFEVMILLCPSHAKYEETLLWVSLLDYPFPVYFDSEFAFRSLNPFFSDDSHLHTVSVNADGQIVLVGDPRVNDKMLALFKERMNI